MIDVGQTIGNYKITAKLGEGGMGVVFLAEHPVIGKKAAMKAIHPELSRNAEVVSRFMIEAKSVNQIGHEHIVDTPRPPSLSGNQHSHGAPPPRGENHPHRRIHKR